MDISLLKNERGLLSLVELADPRPLAAALGLAYEEPANEAVICDVMHSLLVTAGQQTQGLVVEADWGLPTYSEWVQASSLPEPPALVLRIDALNDTPAAEGSQPLPIITSDWGVEQIKNNYALAFLELHYHPAEAQALAKKQLVAELFDFCQTEGTQLVLKLVISGGDGESPGAPETQLTAVQELRANAHVLALEVPRDPLAVATLTAELDIPWIATAAVGDSFPQFSDNLGQALENGALGYLVGQTAWADIAQLKRADHAADINQVKTFINRTYRERLESLNTMLAEVV